MSCPNQQAFGEEHIPLLDVATDELDLKILSTYDEQNDDSAHKGFVAEHSYIIMYKACDEERVAMTRWEHSSVWYVDEDTSELYMIPWLTDQ